VLLVIVGGLLLEGSEEVAGVTEVSEVAEDCEMIVKRIDLFDRDRGSEIVDVDMVDYTV
jgi:hypothetical protein